MQEEMKRSARGPLTRRLVNPMGPPRSLWVGVRKIRLQHRKVFVKKIMRRSKNTTRVCPQMTAITQEVSSIKVYSYTYLLYVRAVQDMAASHLPRESSCRTDHIQFKHYKIWKFIVGSSHNVIFLWKEANLTDASADHPDIMNGWTVFFLASAHLKYSLSRESFFSKGNRCNVSQIKTWGWIFR